VNCEILDTLYVRANGDVPCNDDAGEAVLLGKIPPLREDWSVRSLVANHNYRHVREALQRGSMPWPRVCPTCAFFRPNENPADSLVQRRIRKLQIEPSLACRLRCPGCANQHQVRVRTPPLHLDYALFERLLRRVRDGGFSVGEIEYCGQGEPLLHPEFPSLVRLAREYFPATTQRLITSGNFDYATATGCERLDEIYVSCDGLDPGSYQRYRVGGRVELPLQFMRDAAGPLSPRPQAVVWKYILFEWNDSPDELLRAQILAQELDVAYLLFVYTHSAGKSRRHTVANHARFPRHFPNVIVNATPIHYQLAAEPAALV
jgi:pyruvate-formate lyase-activating enzyme